MGEETAFENGRISDFQWLVTLTLDRVILHTVIHHSSTSTYIQNFIEIKETFCGRTDVRTGGRTFETHFIRSTQRRRPTKEEYLYNAIYKLCISQSDQAWIIQFYLQIHHACLSFVSVHQMAPPLTEVADIQLQLTTQLSTLKE